MKDINRRRLARKLFDLTENGTSVRCTFGDNITSVNEDVAAEILKVIALHERNLLWDSVLKWVAISLFGGVIAFSVAFVVADALLQ